MFIITIINCETLPEDEARQRRIRDSEDPLEQTIKEAEKAGYDSDKYSLYMQAAKLALDAKRFEYAAEITLRAPVSDDSNVDSQSGEYNYREQFLDEIAGEALKAKQPDVAENISHKITDDWHKSFLMQRLISYYLKNNNALRARELFYPTIEAIERIKDYSRRANITLDFVPTALKIDLQFAPRVMQSGAQAVNALPLTNPKIKSEENLQRTKALLYATENISTATHALAKVNEQIARDFSGLFRMRELKLAAISSIYFANSTKMPSELLPKAVVAIKPSAS